MGKIVIISCPGHSASITKLLTDTVTNHEHTVLIDNKDLDSELSQYKKDKQRQIDLLNNELKMLSKVPYNPKFEKNNAKINHRRKPRKLFH